MRKLLLSLSVFVICAAAGGAVTFDTDTLVQTGDYYDYADLDPWPATTATLTMTGGRIDNLSTWVQSITNMSGGSVGQMYMYEASVANVSGGAHIESLETYSDSDTVFSIAYITGGAVDQLDCYGDSQVHLYGYGFNYDPDYAVNTGLMTGFWADADPFSILLWNAPQTRDNVYLHEVPVQVVPAPGALLLAGTGIGAMVLSGRRRQISL